MKQPGVYQIKPNTLVFELILQAGGALDEAALNQLDLSQKLVSNQKINIPFTQAQNVTPTKAPSRSISMTSTINTFINVNEASASQLCALPGIGSKTALAIIQYRQQKGPFRTAKDLLNIKGLGEKKIAKFKDKLRF